MLDAREFSQLMAAIYGNVTLSVGGDFLVSADAIAGLLGTFTDPMMTVTREGRSITWKSSASPPQSPAKDR